MTKSARGMTSGALAFFYPLPPSLLVSSLSPKSQYLVRLGSLKTKN